MRQMYNLGSFFREDYIKNLSFLSEERDNSVEFFSSSLQRTQLSAYSFVYGLYPLKSGPTIELINNNNLDPPF
jgi:hypothetical protein